MAQGTFVQALRKEAALSGTFMKGRSLMLNGAVLSIEDSGSRFSKNVTVEGSVRAGCFGCAVNVRTGVRKPSTGSAPLASKYARAVAIACLHMPG